MNLQASLSEDTVRSCIAHAERNLRLSSGDHLITVKAHSGTFTYVSEVSAGPTQVLVCTEIEEGTWMSEMGFDSVVNFSEEED